MDQEQFKRYPSWVGVNLLGLKPEKETQRAPQHPRIVPFTLGHNGTNVEVGRGRNIHLLTVECPSLNSVLYCCIRRTAGTKV